VSAGEREREGIAGDVPVSLGFNSHPGIKVKSVLNWSFRKGWVAREMSPVNCQSSLDYGPFWRDYTPLASALNAEKNNKARE